MAVRGCVIPLGLIHESFISVDYSPQFTHSGFFLTPPDFFFFFGRGAQICPTLIQDDVHRPVFVSKACPKSLQHTCDPRLKRICEPEANIWGEWGPPFFFLFLFFSFAGIDGAETQEM